MGDKGGKKTRKKVKKNLDKHRQKANEKLKKQQKGQPELGLPHKNRDPSYEFISSTNKAFQGNSHIYAIEWS